MGLEKTLIKVNFNSKITPFLIPLFVLLLGIVLSIFRTTTGDESLYFRDVSIMAETLKAGKWFGNEAVGLHGFLFKIPAAILFVIFGKSIFLATLTNIILASLSTLIFFSILKQIFSSDSWAFVGTFLLAMNFQFIYLTPMFNRDIPGLFALLLFLEFVIFKRKTWLIGIALLLILDGKEYIFFMVFPAYLFWVFVDEIKKSKLGSRLIAIANMLRRWAIGGFPSLIYLFLMMFTSIVPINMYIPFIFGLTDKSNFGMLHYFSPAIANRNYWSADRAIVQSVFKGVKMIQLTPPETGFFKSIVTIFNYLLVYTGKFFYPNTFSFITIPKLMAIPSLISSFFVFRFWKWKNNSKLFILPFLLWIYFIIFIIREGHGRYLFPIFPIFIIFFLFFLKRSVESFRFFMVIISLSGISFLIGLNFDRIDILIKNFY